MTHNPDGWTLSDKDILPGARPIWRKCRKCHMRSRRLRFVRRGKQGCEWCKAMRFAKEFSGRDV